jgi:hypothetical protein
MKTLPGINFACLNPAGFYPYQPKSLIISAKWPIL